MDETKKKHREVKLKTNSYQPSKADLDADLRVSASFDQAVKALVNPVDVKRDG